MRIGFDAKRLFNNFTGLGNYSRYIVSALSTYYPDNDYFLYSPKVKRDKTTEAFFDSSRYHVRLPSGMQSVSPISAFWRTWSLGKVAATDGVELFHGLSHELPITKPRGLKTVVTIHDLIFMRYPEFYNSIDVAVYTWKLKRAVQSADRIIAISEQTKSDALEFLKADPSKIDVVYQGCNPIFKKRYPLEEVSRIRLKYSLPDNFLLNVGSIEYRKNALIILEAMGKMKNKVPVVIVGRKTEYQKKLNEAISACKLEHLVHFIHDVVFEELPIIYGLANVFVYPSLFEGFGIPIVEAISCGVPVVTSTGSCFMEAGGQASVYVNPSNSDELADVLDRLLHDDQARKLMVENSLRNIQKFEPEIIASDLMRSYGKIN